MDIFDGKPVSGRGRLIDAEKDNLQVYYGKAIREYSSDIIETKTALWATYFHLLSTDEKPYELSSKGEKSWYK